MKMKVRAKQDGHYGGYYRLGPYENPDGTTTPGEVFEIDATPREVRLANGKPMQDVEQTGEINSFGQPVLKPVWILDSNGKPKKDAKGNLIPKIKMATFYSPEWMEPVNEDATVTFPSQDKPLGVLPQMMPSAAKNPNNIAARPINLPADVAEVLANAIPRSESPI